MGISQGIVKEWRFYNLSVITCMNIFATECFCNLSLELRHADKNKMSAFCVCCSSLRMKNGDLASIS